MRRVQSLTLFLGCSLRRDPTDDKTGTLATGADRRNGLAPLRPGSRRSIWTKIHRAEDSSSRRSSRRWTGALKEGRKTWLIWNYPSRVPRQRT